LNSIFLTFQRQLDTISVLSVLVFLLIKRPKSEGAFYWFCAFIYSMSAFYLVAFSYQLYCEHCKFTGNNYLMYHIACILYVITLYKFFSILIKSKYKLVIDIIFLIPFLILSIYNFIYLRTTLIIYALTSVWVTIKSLTYYTQKFTQPANENILNNRTFWIVSGLLLYFASAFFIFLSWDLFAYGYIKGRITFYIPLWTIHNIILAISCCFFIKAISLKAEDVSELNA